ncbi:hypothetical protein MTO96_028145 [Rhipicephalus appendiculatus]
MDLVSGVLRSQSTLLEVPRADSQTGYLLEFQVYEGKNASRPSDLGLGEHIVLSLSENVQPGSQLYFDNYFTSTRLMEALAKKNILAVGTVRVNRRDLPKEMKEDNKLKKGEYIWRAKGPVTAYQWRDTKNVHVLSNFHHPEDTEAKTAQVTVICEVAAATSAFLRCPLDAVPSIVVRRRADVAKARCERNRVNFQRPVSPADMYGHHDGTSLVRRQSDAQVAMHWCYAQQVPGLPATRAYLSDWK